MTCERRSYAFDFGTPRSRARTSKHSNFRQDNCAILDENSVGMFRERCEGLNANAEFGEFSRELRVLLSSKLQIDRYAIDVR